MNDEPEPGLRPVSSDGNPVQTKRAIAYRNAVSELV
jgi:hypothetical protein